MFRRIATAVVIVLVCRADANAQWVVHDAAVTARNTVTATVKELLVALQREQHDLLRRMAARLSALTDLSKYAPPDPPDWGVPAATGLPASRGLEWALQVGDADGRAYATVTQRVSLNAALLARLSPQARRTFTSALATLDLADATITAAINDVGRLRDSGRSVEARAIDTLAARFIDGSSAEGTTAVLEKSVGADLIGARQKQARIRLLNHVVEQLLVDTKRARDTESTALNMQLATWQSSAAANRALVDGAADALTSWRQP
jgi:hypothetical protein